MEDVRHVMGLPEWMLSIDSRKTKTLHGGACIQMLVHFKGGQAHKIEKDLTILIASGRLNDPSIAIPGYVDQKRKPTLSYRTCGVRDPNEKGESGVHLHYRRVYFYIPSILCFTDKNNRGIFYGTSGGSQTTISHVLIGLTMYFML